MRSLIRTLIAVIILCLGLPAAAGAGAAVLELPDNLEVIETEAFYGDTGLAEVKFPDTLREIGDRAFMNSSLQKAEIPSSVQVIGEDAFAGLPDSAVLTVSKGSAAETYFSSVEHAFTVKVIREEDNRNYWDEYDFRWYTISGSDKIEVWIFGLKEDSTLTGLKFNSSYYDWEIEKMVIKDHAFQNCTRLTEAPVFPDYLTEIRESAFEGCTQMRGELVFPDSLQVLEQSAFRGCTSLTGVRFSSGPETIGYHAFQGCSGLSGTLVLPSGLKNLQGEAFACNSTDESGDSGDAPGFTSVVFPEGLEEIGYSAFEGCRTLTGSLSIPDSVETISSRAFMNCGYNGTLQLGSGLNKIGGSAFRGCRFSGNLRIPDSVTEIDPDAFGHFEQDTSSSGLEGITGPGQFTGSLHLGSGVETIGDGAFGGCGFTGSLVIPDSVRTIGSGAFAGLDNMKGSLALGNGVTSIGSYAFYRSAFSGSLTIPDSVYYLGSSAFKWCSRLSGTLTIGSDAWAHDPPVIDGIITRHDNTFLGCSGLRTLVIEEGAISIPGLAFADCTSLTTAELPSTLKYIEGQAFENCTSLTNLRFPESLYWIWPEVFKNCTSLNGILDISHLKEDSLRYSQFINCTSLRGVIAGERTFTSLTGSYGSDPFQGTSPYFTIYCPSPSAKTAQAAAEAGYRWSVSGLGSGYGLPSGELEFGEVFDFRGVYRAAQEILNLRAILKDAEGTVLKTVVLPVGARYVLFSSLNEHFRIEELPLGDYVLTIELNTSDKPSTYWNYAITSFTIVPSLERVWSDRADDLPRGLLIAGEGFETKAVLSANRVIRRIHVQLTRDETNIWDYALDVGERQIPMADVLEDLELSSRGAGTYQVTVEVFLAESETGHTRSSEFSVFELDGSLDEDLARSIVLWCQDPSNRDVFDESDSSNFLNRLSNWDVAAIILCNYDDINMDRLAALLKGQGGDGHVTQIYKASIYNMIKDLSGHIPEIASASDVLPFQDYITKELEDFESVASYSINEVKDAYDSYSRYLQREYNARKSSADAAEKLFFKDELAYLKELEDVTEGFGAAMEAVSFGKDVMDIFIRAQLDYHNGLYVLKNLRDAYGDDAPVEFMNALNEVITEYSSKEMTYLSGAVQILEGKLMGKLEDVVQDGVLTGLQVALGESVSSISLTFGIVKFVVDEGLAPFAQDMSDRDMDFLSAYNLLRDSRRAYHHAFDDVYENGGTQTSERLSRVYATFLAARYAISECYKTMEAMAENDGDSDLAEQLETRRLGFIRLSID